MRLLLRCLLILLCTAPVGAQEFDADDLASVSDAQAVLDRTLPAEPAEARLQLLQQQVQAAMQLGQRAQQVKLSRQLVDEGRAHRLWPSWLRIYLSSEFSYGRATLALDACEAWIADRSLPLGLRAGVALRQTYMTAVEGELAPSQRQWERAQGLLKELGDRPPSSAEASHFLAIDALQTRAEVERLQGRLAASTASLREALPLAKAKLAQVRAQRDAELIEHALGWLDNTRGMLVYALVRQGRAAEALQLADEQVQAVRRGELGAARGPRWSYRQAHALNALQRHAQALAAADESREQLRRVGVLETSHTGHLALAERVRALLGLHRWSEADAAYQAHLAAVAGDRLTNRRARSPALLVVLAAMAGRIDEALEQADRSLRYRERLYGREHPLSQEMAGARGFVQLRRGDLKAARADLERLFVATLDSPSGWLDLEQRGNRGFVLGLVYDESLRQLLNPSSDAEAVDRGLQIADRLKLGSTQRALVDASSRLQAATPALQAALEAEQAARVVGEQRFETLQALFVDEDAIRKRMVSPEFKELPVEQRRAQRDALEALRERIKAAQQQATQARAALQAQREAIARQFPAYADLVSPTLPRTAELARSLKPGEALLVVHPLESGTLVWLIQPGRAAELRALPIGEAALNALVSSWRAGLDRSSRPGDAAPAHEGATAGHALHQALLEPLRASLQGVDSLIVVSQGPLASVPLAALPRQVPQTGQAPAWLLRDMAVTQLPSAASLLALRRQPSAVPPRALLGYGDPLFEAAVRPAGTHRSAGKLLAPPPGRTAIRWDEQRGLRYGAIPPLPDTRDELQAIAMALGADAGKDLRLGTQATRSRLLAEDLSQPRVLVFATHGLLPGELPGLSKPALALAAEGEANPLLELDDVLGLRLRAHWVLLSACNTAGAQSGDEAMSGLVRGFFFAGARSVLATHWAVESASAAALAAQVFKEERGAGSRAQALRRAQLKLADGELGAGAWRHPYFWAGHALFGDP